MSPIQITFSRSETHIFNQIDIEVLSIVNAGLFPLGFQGCQS